MNYDEFRRRYLIPYESLNHHYEKYKGFIVWRRGTGGNVELLHIKTFEKGKGYGRELFYVMLDRLIDNLPYYSIFGFTRTSNEEAQRFYGALGFNLQEINGLYKDGKAIMFWQSYESLLKSKEQYENSIRGQAQ